MLRNYHLSKINIESKFQRNKPNTQTSEFLQPVFENNRKQGYVFEINFKSRLGNSVETKYKQSAGLNFRREFND